MGDKENLLRLIVLDQLKSYVKFRFCRMQLCVAFYCYELFDNDDVFLPKLGFAYGNHVVSLCFGLAAIPTYIL